MGRSNVTSEGVLRAFLGKPVLLGGLIYIVVGAVMALSIPAETLRHTWIEHLLFVQNGPASAHLAPLQRLPKFDAADDNAFCASVVIAAGVMFLAMGVWGSRFSLAHFFRDFPRLSGVLSGYMIAVHIGDAMAGRVEWLQFGVNAGWFVFFYVAAGTFLSEALRRATTTEFFRDNHLVPVIDGLLTLLAVFLLSFRYEDDLLALMGGVLMLAWLALWSYLYELISRGVVALSLSGRALNQAFEREFEQAGRLTLAQAFSLLRRVLAGAVKRYLAIDLYREFDAALHREIAVAHADPNAVNLLMRRVGFWLNFAWLVLVIPGLVFGYWLIFRAP